MTTEPQVLAGWYPDPLGLPQSRWWDGLAWTEHVSDARRPLVAQTVRSVAYASAEPVHAAEQVVTQVPATPAPAAPPVTPPARPAVTLDEGPRALPAGDPDHRELGWDGAARTLQSIQDILVPMVMEIRADGHPPITVDSRHRAYAWDLELDRFPMNPASVRVSITPIDPSAPPAVELPGRSLDALLWKMSTAAFAEAPAPWIDPRTRYRLERWPNMTELRPEMDQMRQTALLSNGAFSVAELAAYSGKSLETTQTLFNALGLLGALVAAGEVAQDAAETPAAPAPAPASAPAASSEAEPMQEDAPVRGLLGRLRARFGG